MLCSSGRQDAVLRSRFDVAWFENWSTLARENLEDVKCNKTTVIIEKRSGEGCLARQKY